MTALRCKEYGLNLLCVASFARMVSKGKLPERKPDFQTSLMTVPVAEGLKESFLPSF